MESIKDKHEKFIDRPYFHAILNETEEMGIAMRSEDNPAYWTWYPDNDEYQGSRYPWNRMKSWLSESQLTFIGEETTSRKELENAIKKALKPLEEYVRRQTEDFWDER